MRTTTAVPETQCRATLQAELDLGGTLYVPAGRYLLDGALNIAKGALVMDEDAELYSTLGGTVLRVGGPAASGKWLFQSSQWSSDCSGAMLTVDVQPNWQPNQTFICGSWYNGEPGPWYLLADAGGVRWALVYRDPNRVTQVLYIPMQNPLVLTLPSMWANCPTRRFEVNDQLSFNQLSLPWFKLLESGHGYGSGIGHAFAVRENMLTSGPVRIRGGKLQGGDSYGQVLSLGTAYNVLIEETRVAGGAQGIGSLDLGNLYTLHLRDCEITGQSHCPLYLDCVIGECDDLNLGYPIVSAAILKACNISFRNTFVTNSSTVQDVFSMLDGRGCGGAYHFSDTTCDFEGGSPPSYWNCEIHANCPSTELRIDGNVALGKLGGPAHVILRECELGGVTGPGTARIPKELSVQKGVSWTLLST